MKARAIRVLVRRSSLRVLNFDRRFVTRYEPCVPVPPEALENIVAMSARAVSSGARSPSDKRSEKSVKEAAKPAVKKPPKKSAAASKTPTAITLQPRLTMIYESGYTIPGQLIDASTHQGIKRKTVSYSFGSKRIGSITTSASGMTSLLFQTAPTWKPATDALNVALAGDSLYNRASNSAVFVIAKGPAILAVPRVYGKPPSRVTLVATAASRITGRSRRGLSISFNVAGLFAGRATPGTNGAASLTCYVNGVKERPVKARVDGDNLFDKTASASSIKPIP